MMCAGVLLILGVRPGAGAADDSISNASSAPLLRVGMIENSPPFAFKRSGQTYVANGG